MHRDNDSEGKPARQTILVVDDTLDLELKKHRLIHHDSTPDWLFGRLGNTGIDLIHVTSQEEAVRRLQYMKEQYLDPNGWEPTAPENITVISDYKIQHPGHPDEWGPDILQTLAADKDYRPANLFLMSKSGFRDQDQPKLDAIGAKYFHTNEFLFAAAAQAQDEALMEVFSQRATTHLFRQWCNEKFGTEFSLEQYLSPNISEVERGHVPVEEVIRRVNEDKISHAEAVQLLDERSVSAAFRSRVDAQATEALHPEKCKTITYGIEGSSVCGRLAYSAEDIARIHAEMPEAKIILVLDHDYSPADDAVCSKASGIIMLARGAQHIQIWAKDAGMPVLFANKEDWPDFSVKDGVLLMRHEGMAEPTEFARTGDALTIDGSSLTVYAGALPIYPPHPATLAAAEEMARIGDYHNKLTWHYRAQDGSIADHSGVGVMANASSAAQVALAKSKKGVRGIGLLRTEPMVREESRRLLLLKALLAEGDEKTDALAEFTRLHAQDLDPVFALQDEHFPINVRLFDFPPSEFFPDPADDAAIETTAAAIGVDAAKLRELSTKAYETNLRGAGFALAYPEIAHAQCEAIFTAAANHSGVTPRILIPAVRNAAQVTSLRALMNESAAHHGQPSFLLGSMVETKDLTPEVYVGADVKPLQDVVRQSDFLCLGTNDLTEELLGIKRNDLESQLAWNRESRNPIKPFDELAPRVKRAIEDITWRAREIKPDIPITLCGDQATSRSTVEFCQYKNLGAISVPATDAAITQALVETGRASLIEATEHREKMNADKRAREQAKQDLKNGKMPDEVETPDEEAIKNSPIAFIFIEDDGLQKRDLAEFLEGYPILICDSISDGLKAAAAMRAKGKAVHLYSDANVPRIGYSDYGLGTQHPDCAQIAERERVPPGVCFAEAVHDGKIDGLHPNDLTILSANYQILPEGVRGRHKLGFSIKDMQAEMDERMEEARQAVPVPTVSSGIVASTITPNDASLIPNLPSDVINVSPNVLAEAPAMLIMIEDEEESLEDHEAYLKGTPALLCRTVSDGLKAADVMRALGKKVHIVTDASVPDAAYRDSTPHPAIAEIEDSPGEATGLQLINAICAGKIDGLGSGDVSLLTANPGHDVPQGVEYYDKYDHPFFYEELKARLAEMTAAAATPNEVSALSNLPEDIINLSPNVLAEAPAVLIMIEDDDIMLQSYRRIIKGLPVLLCKNASDGLKAVDAMQALGKRVHIITDAGIPAAAYGDPAPHPCISQLQNAGGETTGLQLIHAISEGKIEGLSLNDVSLLSGNPTHQPPAGVEKYNKLDDNEILYIKLANRIEAMNTAAKNNPSADQTLPNFS